MTEWKIKDFQSYLNPQKITCCSYALASGGMEKASWDFSPPVLQMRMPMLLYTELALVNSSALGTICSLHDSLLLQLFY